MLEDRIYTYSKYIPVGKSGDIAVLSLAGARSILNESARRLFADWYDKLSVDHIYTFADHEEARKLARAELVDKKPKDISVIYEPKDLVLVERVADILAGYVSLEEAVMTRLENARSKIERTKAIRTEMVELVRQGNVLNNYEKDLIAALQKEKFGVTESIVVEFEHDGVVRSTNLTTGVLKNILKDGTGLSRMHFSSFAAGGEAIKAFFGNAETRIPISYISSVKTRRGRIIYLRT